jgi:5-oxoprolinase (ATP-hydrolysing) subunit A
MRIDLNCDLGEFDDPEQLVLQEQIMPLVTSANIACGFHAGNHDLMRRMVRLAQAHGVAIGAHPGVHDRAGFGRQAAALSPDQVENLVAYQIGALAGIAALEGAALNHVKPHGALYNMAARDRIVAEAIVAPIAAIDRRLILFALAGSALVDAGRLAGLAVAEEAFVDRAYNRDGSLVPRHNDGAVVCDDSAVITRVRRMLEESLVLSHDGSPIVLHADTICLHGDTPGSRRLAELIRRELTDMGVQVRAVSRAGA